MCVRSFMGLIQRLQANQEDARIVEIATESPTALAIKADLEDGQKRWLVVGICLHSVISPALRTYIPPVVSTLYNKLQQSDNIHQQTYPNQLKRYRPTNKELNYEAINNNVTIPKVRGKRDEPNYDYKVTNDVDLSKLFLQTHMAHYNAFDDTCDSSALLGIIIGLDVFPALVKQGAEKVRADIRNAWAHCNFTEWDIIKYQTTFQMMHQFIRNLVLPLQDEAAILGKLTHWETNDPRLAGFDVDARVRYKRYSFVDSWDRWFSKSRKIGTVKSVDTAGFVDVLWDGDTDITKKHKVGFGGEYSLELCNTVDFP